MPVEKTNLVRFPEFDLRTLEITNNVRVPCFGGFKGTPTRSHPYWNRGADSYFEAGSKKLFDLELLCSRTLLSTAGFLQTLSNANAVAEASGAGDGFVRVSFLEGILTVGLRGDRKESNHFLGSPPFCI